MEATEFERLIAELWSKQGWKTQLTQEVGDRGIDIVATRNDPVSEKHLIQAKRYGSSNSVGSPDIQQYASLRQQEDSVDAVIIVTSSQFTTQAKEIADDLNVKLVDGDRLCELINSLEVSIGQESQTAKEPAGQRNSADTSSMEDNKWVRGILGSLLCLISAFVAFTIASVMINQNYSTFGLILITIAMFLTVLAYIGSVSSIYYDTKLLQEVSSWNPNSVAWTVGSLLAGFPVVVYYLYKRKEAVGDIIN